MSSTKTKSNILNPDDDRYTIPAAQLAELRVTAQESATASGKAAEAAEEAEQALSSGDRSISVDLLLKLRTERDWWQTIATADARDVKASEHSQPVYPSLAVEMVEHLEAVFAIAPVIVDRFPAGASIGDPPALYVVQSSEAVHDNIDGSLSGTLRLMHVIGRVHRTMAREEIESALSKRQIALAVSDHGTMNLSDQVRTQQSSLIISAVYPNVPIINEIMSWRVDRAGNRAANQITSETYSMTNNESVFEAEGKGASVLSSDLVDGQRETVIGCTMYVRLNTRYVSPGAADRNELFAVVERAIAKMEGTAAAGLGRCVSARAERMELLDSKVLGTNVNLEFTYQSRTPQQS